MAGYARTISALAAVCSLAAQDYVTGDECLFCHRNSIGISWRDNRHNLTTRQDAASGFLLGAGRLPPRPLKKTGYGVFQLAGADFARQCAGCHVTRVDSRTLQWAAYGLDCVTCHGSVDLKHTKDTSLVLLSKKRSDDARTVNAICGSCHLRGGRSRSTGLPYPVLFMPGADLFADFAVSFDAPERADRHVYGVVQIGERACTECHTIHSPDKNAVRKAGRSSTVCRY